MEKALNLYQHVRLSRENGISDLLDEKSRIATFREKYASNASRRRKTRQNATDDATTTSATDHDL